MSAFRTRAASRSSSRSSCAESRAPELAGFHETDEEREELVVLVEPGMTEPRDRVLAHRREHADTVTEDDHPLGREVLGLGPVETGARKELPVPGHRLKRRGRHPLGEAM